MFSIEGPAEGEVGKSQYFKITPHCPITTGLIVTLTDSVRGEYHESFILTQSPISWGFKYSTDMLGPVSIYVLIGTWSHAVSYKSLPSNTIDTTDTLPSPLI